MSTLIFALIHRVFFDDSPILDNAAVGLGFYSVASFFFPAVNLAQVNIYLQFALLVLSILFVIARFTHWIIRRVRGERTDTSQL